MNQMLRNHVLIWLAWNAFVEYSDAEETVCLKAFADALSEA